eukprot:TRINITY_DN90507_c0_g1_i1.p1 TRINITY_DN90507_c0_g1~~TRINITY_DN90507_c0_g1_i1.p1  ORF type:complete len:886 (+),score=257.33 TRINITY_DN90507_c0_g1_i1:158-2815(+)
MDFKLIPISQDCHQWQCSVLKLGGATVLLNCGWTEALDPALLEPLIPYLGELDLILLTHSDLKHIGAIPYLLSRFSVACPVVSTEPVCRLGELTCVSCVEDRDKYMSAMEDLEVDDILRVFMSRLTSLSYRESFMVQPRGGKSLTVCAHPAGGSLGSCYWTLQCGGLSAVYLVDGSLRRGRFLDGFDLKQLLPPPRGTALRWDVIITSEAPAITSSLPQRGVCQQPQEGHAMSRCLAVVRNMREKLLLEDTINALWRGGTVIIPADVVGWTPEVLLLLENAWKQDRQLSKNYPLVWLSSTGDMVLDQVKTRLEYMSQEVLRMFEKRFGQHPFIMRHLQVFQSLEELCATHPLSKPKVIIASSPHLMQGDARELVLRLAGDPRTLLWLLGVAPAGTLARQLLDDFVLGSATAKEYRVQQSRKQVLSAEQLTQYYEAKLQELADSGLAWPATLPAELNPKAFDQMPDEKPFFEMEEAADEVKKEDVKQEVKEEPKDDKSKQQAKKPKARGAHVLRDMKSGTTGALWTPMGWPGSRTLAHGEARHEGDEYGHLLAPSEVKEWRASDQEGNKYANPMAEAPMDEAEPPMVKEEKAKVEDEVEKGEHILDYQDILRTHFKEPSICDVRELTLRVCCSVKYLPDAVQEPHDLSSMICMMAPRRVVLLPAVGEPAATETAPELEKQLRHARIASGTAAPEVHRMTGERPLQLMLRSLKRRIQFSTDLWQQTSFSKTLDGVKVARVRAVPQAGAQGSEQKMLELGGVTDSTQEAELPRLPRDAALFVSAGREPVSLSDLKDKMSGTEWGGTVAADFQPPSATTSAARSWSSRVLSADGHVSLSWSSDPNGADRSSLSGAGDAAGGSSVLRLEGVPGEQFFRARAALYRACALV